LQKGRFVPALFQKSGAYESGQLAIQRAKSAAKRRPNSTHE
jgi:hypothetical protein